MQSILDRADQILNLAKTLENEQVEIFSQIESARSTTPISNLPSPVTPEISPKNATKQTPKPKPPEKPKFTRPSADFKTEILPKGISKKRLDQIDQKIFQNLKIAENNLRKNVHFNLGGQRNHEIREANLRQSGVIRKGRAPIPRPPSAPIPEPRLPGDTSIPVFGETYYSPETSESVDENLLKNVNFKENFLNQKVKILDQYRTEMDRNFDQVLLYDRNNLKNSLKILAEPVKNSILLSRPEKSIHQIENLADLPSHVLIKIFQLSINFDSKSLEKLMLVCKKFYQISESFDILVDLTNLVKFPKNPARRRQIRQLNFKRVNFGPVENSDPMTWKPATQEIDSTRTCLNFNIEFLSFFNQLKFLSNLSEINFSYCSNIEFDVLFENLDDFYPDNTQNSAITRPKFPNLKKLDLSWCNLEGQILQKISGNLPNLVKLNLSGNFKLKDEDFMMAKFSSLWRLEELNLRGCYNLTHLDFLPKNLSYLDISLCKNLNNFKNLYLRRVFDFWLFRQL